MTSDLGRLRLKGLIDRILTTHRVDEAAAIAA